jgi:uncharacterized protein
MAAELPDEVDCGALADAGASLSGTVSAGRMRRLAAAYAVDGPARVALRFARDRDGRPWLEGEIEVALAASCQRCLEAVPIAIRTALRAVAIEDEREAVDGDDYVVAPAGRLALAAPIEDEIMLACPMIVAHDDVACRPPEVADDAGPAPVPKPFAGLAALLKR